jgi:hypothetical protein
VRAGLLRLFRDWSPRLTPMLQASDDDCQPCPFCACPSRQAWRPRPDVTLLGDAAHIMPPFTGRGVNYAVLDRMAGAIEETMASQAMMFAPSDSADLAAHVEEAICLARRFGRKVAQQEMHDWRHPAGPGNDAEDSARSVSSCPPGRKTEIGRSWRNSAAYDRAKPRNDSCSAAHPDRAR